MENKIKVIGAGLICIDIIQSGLSSIVMNGGSCANVLSVLSQVGYDCCVIREQYKGPLEELLSNTLRSLGVNSAFYKKANTPPPCVIELLTKQKHTFSTSCPSCGKKILSLHLPTVSNIRPFIDKLSSAAVFYCDRTSSGIRAMMKIVHESNGLIVYEPNSARNQKTLIETAAQADIVKCSKERIQEGIAELLRVTCDNKLVIVTDGDRGLSFSHRTSEGLMSPWITIPSSFEKPVVDSSGAGDWLTAGFIAELLKKQPFSITEILCDRTGIIELIKKGMKYSELCCTTVGAQGAFYLPKYGNEISNLSSQIIENPNFTEQNSLNSLPCPYCNSSLL